MRNQFRREPLLGQLTSGVIACPGFLAQSVTRIMTAGSGVVDSLARDH